MMKGQTWQTWWRHHSNSRWLWSFLINSDHLITCSGRMKPGLNMCFHYSRTLIVTCKVHSVFLSHLEWKKHIYTNKFSSSIWTRKLHFAWFTSQCEFTLTWRIFKVISYIFIREDQRNKYKCSTLPLGRRAKEILTLIFFFQKEIVLISVFSHFKFIRQYPKHVIRTRTLRWSHNFIYETCKSYN